MQYTGCGDAAQLYGAPDRRSRCSPRLVTAGVRRHMRVSTLVLLLIALAPVCAFATGQIADEILIDGKSRMLFSEPFMPYLSDPSEQAKLKSYLSGVICSASWRGYRAHWKIRDTQLLLVKLVADPCGQSPKDIPLTAFFPNHSGPVPATWFSGKLVVPMGRLVKSVRSGYDSRYEWYVVLTVRKGVVLNRLVSAEPPK